MPPNEAHLQMIQDVVTRLANNSFLLKGWTVTLVAGLFALGAASQGAWLGIVALGPTLAFWCLDAYYLQQERLFRRVYDKVRTSNADLQFALNPMQVLSEEERKDKTLTREDAFHSETEKGFYLPLIFVILIASVPLIYLQLKASSPDSKQEGRPAALAPATPGK